MLVLENVHRSFGTFKAVQGVSLSIEPGNFVGVIGRSGAGKSTLLRLVNRLLDPTDGVIRCGDTEVSQLTGRDLRVFEADEGTVI